MRKDTARKRKVKRRRFDPRQRLNTIDPEILRGVLESLCDFLFWDADQQAYVVDKEVSGVEAVDRLVRIMEVLGLVPDEEDRPCA